MDRQALLDLADRCEKVEGPDAALDAEIAEAVSAERRPVYTASLDAALELVPEGHGWDVGLTAGQIDAMVTKPAKHGFLIDGDEESHGRGATPALALTAAALRARPRAQVSPATEEKTDGPA